MILEDSLRRRAAGIRVLAVSLLTLSLTASAVGQANLTVGDAQGSDHIGYVFAPFRWTDHRGETSFREHVGSAAAEKGQQYTVVEYLEAVKPNPGPLVCTVDSFKALIQDNSDKLGILLITSHGCENGVAVESYARTLAGQTARDAAYDRYVSQGLRPDVDIFKSGRGDLGEKSFYCIAVTDQFLLRFGRMTQGLAYVGSCHGASLTDDFVEDAHARIAVGNIGTADPGEQEKRVRQFFQRLDGKEGPERRHVAGALADALGFVLQPCGKEETTLTPAVSSINIPCEITAGNTVTITMDTECNTQLAPPDIVGDGCTIVNEKWINATTLQGQCTAPQPPEKIENYSLRLKFQGVQSKQNEARLDGNDSKPCYRNAEGPAHDDFIAASGCDMNCDGAVNFDDINPFVEALSDPAGYRAKNPNCVLHRADFNNDLKIDFNDIDLFVYCLVTGSLCK